MFVSLKMSAKCPCHKPSCYAPAEGLEPFVVVRVESKNKSRWLAPSEVCYLKDKNAYLHLRSQPAPHPASLSTAASPSHGPRSDMCHVQVEAVQLTKPSPSSLLCCSRFDSCQMFSAQWLLLLLNWY